jgi:hypothetical protein
MVERPSIPAVGPLLGLALAMVFCAIAAAAVLAAPASASEAIDSFGTATSTTQAGAHPDLQTFFTLHDPGAPESAENVTFNAPEGVFGNPNAITQCTSSDFALDQCPSDSQAGLVTVRGNYNGNPEALLGTAPIFDMVPQPEETARFSFIVPTIDVPIAVPVAVRTGTDYGLRFTVSNITQLVPLAGARLVFWGFPAAQEHSLQRFPKGSPGAPAGCPGIADATCLNGGAASSIPVEPLTDNPTTCTGEELVTTLDVQTYQDPAHPAHQEAGYPATTECDRETFNPVLGAAATTDETDAPSGLDIDLHAPQFLTFAASPSEIRSTVVTLPPGFTINPDAADGQSACLDSQANFGTEGPAECPDNAKIGTFSIHTPALAGRLQGSVYFGEPKPGDQYRLFLIASGFGINAKLVGSVRPDPVTGQITAFFNDLPQVPFDDFQMHLFASDRGLMATPTACTIYTVDGDFFPWNTALADQHSTQIFGLRHGPHGDSCPGQVRPFHPNLVAGTSSPNAGGFSSFILRLDREDGDQFLGKLSFTMPPGLTASLRGISYCSEAAIAAAAQTPGRTEQAAPSCPPSSQIGTSNVAAGPGSHPFHAVGRIYLAGPFKGAPLSLVAMTPALAGPYDYGTVVVRVALKVDRRDAHVTADSEVVPQIIGGVPLRMRSIQVNIDKPNFMINPTGCGPLSVDSQGIGGEGTAVSFSSFFNVVNCETLGFKPRMTIRQLGGIKGTRRSKDPGVQFDLRTRSGDANIKSVGVTLPKTFEIDQRHLGNICSRAQLETESCAGRQAIGTVMTETPLLDAPLAGPAYAVSGFGKLPHVAFILAGQVTLVPEAESASTASGKLRTVVPIVPDAPVGHFRLNLFGGKRGYLANTGSLCAAAAVTQVDYVAQNGKTRSERVKLNTACASGGKKKHKRHRR